jgi:hypothetical protein
VPACYKESAVDIFQFPDDSLSSALMERLVYIYVSWSHSTIQSFFQRHPDIMMASSIYSTEVRFQILEIPAIA